MQLTIIGSDNGLSPDCRQAIIWTNVGLLLIGPLGTNFSEILIKILTFSFKKMHLKVLSAKRRPFCLGLNVLRHYWRWDVTCLEAATAPVHLQTMHDGQICWSPTGPSTTTLWVARVIYRSHLATGRPRLCSTADPLKPGIKSRMKM